MNKKSIYSNDTQWYDPIIYNAITALDAKYPNAIPIFGGALGAYNCINSEHPDFKQFTSYLPSVISSAKFFKWHEGVVGALHTFCHLCLVDPHLVELYIGMTFNELCEA